MFQTRYKLHKLVYTHRVSKAVDHMITDALIAADPVLKLSETIFSPQDYLHVTDHVLTEIEKSKDPVCFSWLFNIYIYNHIIYVQLLLYMCKRLSAEDSR